MRAIAAMMLIYFITSPLAWSEETVRMTGPELVACSVALAKFKAEETKSDIKNYTVYVSENETTYEVVFVPNSPPSKTESGILELHLGGGTVLGREVHYIVSKDSYTIVR